MIMTKREKFKQVMKSNFDLTITVQNLYPIIGGRRGIAPSQVLHHLTSEQKEVYNYLSEIYFKTSDDYLPTVSNSDIYKNALEKALKLYEDVLLDWVGEPITYSHNRGKYETIKDFMDSRFKNYLEAEEWDEDEFGLDFHTEFNGHKIKKLDIERGEDGYSKNHIYGEVLSIDKESLPEEISSMKRGLYVIDEFRFDIMRNEIEIYYKDKNNHPLLKYVIKKSKDNEDNYTPECSRCGDGGCPSCEPWRFI